MSLSLCWLAALPVISGTPVSADASSVRNIYLDAFVGRDDAHEHGLSSTAPLRTAHAAQTAARHLRAGGTEHVAVNVRGLHALERTLEFGPEDAGTTWRGNEEDGRDAVHAGVQIDVSDFKVWKGKILEADLAAYPGLQLGEITGSVGLGTCANNKAELFFNGERMTLARYPNVGDDGLWRWMSAAGGAQNGTGIVYSDDDAERVEGWKNETSSGFWLHGYWKFDWADNYVRVSDIITANKTLVIDSTTPVLYGEVLATARWYALNLLSELDVGGEYFIDRAAKKLYFQPPNGELAPSDLIMISNLSVAVQVQDTSDVHFENLDINYGRSKNLVMGTYSQPVTDSSVRGCSLGGAGDTALEVHGSRITISNNTAITMGCQGFIVNGGSEKSLTPGEIVVEDNHIERFSQWKRTYTPGLSWGGVGNIYRRNIIKDGPHTAAQGGGNDNLFENNNFTRLAYEVTDTGAWYAGRSWARRNNTLRGNIFRDVRNLVPTFLGAPSVQAVYNDDELSGNTFDGNFFYDCHCGIFIGGGRHHVVTNNVFVRVETPVHMDARGLLWQKDYCTAPDGQLWQTLDKMNYKEPPYSTRYPEVLDIDSPCVPVHNRIQGNSWCGSSKFIDFNDDDIKAWNVTLTKNIERPDFCGPLAAEIAFV